MRATLAIDDDILAADKHLAARERMSAGEVISALARQALAQDADGHPGDRNGLPLLPTNESARTVTLELLHQLRDESQ